MGESSKDGIVAFVEVPVGAWKGDIPIRLIDEFGIFWESKSQTLQAACILASKGFDDVRESQGA